MNSLFDSGVFLKVRPGKLIYKKMPILKVLVLLSIFLFAGPLQQLSVAQEVGIKDIVVTNSSTDLLLYLKVEDAFSKDIIEGVQNGLPAVFSFEVQLTMIRSGWPDKEIYSDSIEHTMAYDNLKKNYTVTLEERDGRQTVTNNLENAMFLMEELNGLTVVKLDRLVPDREYVLEVRAVLAKNTLPFNIHYLIPFGDFWDFSTEWYKIRFKY
nr:DUF4390 domain-containing protein [Desulfobulbaceae bacterium]